MTVLGRLIALYPSLILSPGGDNAGVVRLPSCPAATRALPGDPLRHPPLTSAPASEGCSPLHQRLSRLSDRTYAPWWGMHQIQVLYIAIPQLEAVLRLVPGLYSQWLRLWGSKVGRRVYWTPDASRSLIAA